MREIYWRPCCPGTYTEVTVDDFDDSKDVCEEFPCAADKATCLLADGVTLGSGANATGSCSLRAALRLLSGPSTSGSSSGSDSGPSGPSGPSGRRRRALLQGPVGSGGPSAPTPTPASSAVNYTWPGAPMRIFLPGKYVLNKTIVINDDGYDDNPAEIIGTTAAAEIVGFKKDDGPASPGADKEGFRVAEYVAPSPPGSSGPGSNPPGSGKRRRRRGLLQTPGPAPATPVPPSVSQMTFGAAQAAARTKGLTLKNLKWSGYGANGALNLYMEKYTSLVLENVVASGMTLRCEGCHATVKHSKFENADTPNAQQKMDEGWGYLLRPNGVHPNTDNSWPLASKIEVTLMIKFDLHLLQCFVLLST